MLINAFGDSHLHNISNFIFHFRWCQVEIISSPFNVISIMRVIAKNDIRYRVWLENYHIIKKYI